MFNAIKSCNYEKDIISLNDGTGFGGLPQH